MKAANRLAAISESTGDITNLLNARRALVGEDGGREALALLLVELAEGEARYWRIPVASRQLSQRACFGKRSRVIMRGKHSMMGRALSASGNHTESVKCWKSMIQNDKSNPDLWTGLARALESAGTWQQHNDAMKGTWFG